MMSGRAKITRRTKRRVRLAHLRWRSAWRRARSAASLFDDHHPQHSSRRFRNARSVEAHLLPSTCRAQEVFRSPGPAGSGGACVMKTFWERMSTYRAPACSRPIAGAKSTWKTSPPSTQRASRPTGGAASHSRSSGDNGAWGSHCRTRSARE